jgi:hypothetical protein
MAFEKEGITLRDGFPLTKHAKLHTKKTHTHMTNGKRVDY